MTSSSPNNESSAPMDEQTLFWKLSALLTGFNDLDRSLSDEYFKLVQRDLPNELSALCRYYWDVVREPRLDPLAAYIGRLRRAEREDRDNRPIRAARQIVSLWYLSQYSPDGDQVKVAGFRDRGLIWRVIDAHPPSYSSAQHGYWQRPPERR